MNLRKTKSALAILLAVMLIVTSIAIVPVSAATADDTVGDWNNTSYNYVRYSLDGTNWQNATVSRNSDGKFVTPEIEIPAGVTIIHVAFSAEWNNGQRWYKHGSPSREIQPKFGDTTGRFYAYWENAPHDPGTRHFEIPVTPTSKITFQYLDFNNKDDGYEFVYRAYMSSLPTDAVKSVGDVDIAVAPVSDNYTASRNVTITVSNIPSDLPHAQITVGTLFDKGTFTQTNRSSSGTTLTVTGTLNGFTAADVGTGYEAKATASSTYTYTNNDTNVTYSFSASEDTATYDITALPIEYETDIITVSAAVAPASDYYDVERTVTATIGDIPDLAGIDYDDFMAVLTDSKGNSFLPVSTEQHTDLGTKTFYFVVAENTYTAADVGSVTYTASAVYSGGDITVGNVVHTIDDTDTADVATVLTDYPITDTEINLCNPISVTVSPVSDYYTVGRDVTVTITGISDKVDINDIDVALTDSDNNIYTATVWTRDAENRTITGVSNGLMYGSSKAGTTLTYTATAEYTGTNPFTEGYVRYTVTDPAPATATTTFTDVPGEKEEPVVKASGAITVDATPETAAYDAARTVVVNVSGIDEHITDLSEVALTLSDGTNTFTNGTRSNVTAHGFTVTYAVPANTYTYEDIGYVTYTATAHYTGDPIFDADENAYYTFSDCTAADTVSLTVKTDTLSVGSVNVTVVPASDFYDKQRVVTLEVDRINTYISLDDVTITLYDSQRNIYLTPTTTTRSDANRTITNTYLIPDGTYDKSLAGSSVTYYGVATCHNQKVTIQGTEYTIVDDTDNATTELLGDDLRPQGMFLTLLNNIKTTFVVPKASTADYTNIYCTASVDGTNMNWTVDAYSYGTYWAFDFEGVYASLMTSPIRVTVYGTKNGVEVHSAQYVRTIKEYCMTQLAKAQYVNAQEGTLDYYMRSMFVDLLNYGAAIQTYGGVRLDDLANADLTAEQLAYSKSDVTDLTDNRNYHAVAAADPTMEFYGFQIAFANSIEVMPHFRPNNMDGNPASAYNQLPEGGYVEVTYAAQSKIYTADQLLSSGGSQGGKITDYYFKVDMLMANQLDRKVRATVYDADGNKLSDTFEFTVNDWLGKQIDNHTAAGDLATYMGTTEYKALYTMAKYGRSAAALSPFFTT